MSLNLDISVTGDAAIKAATSSLGALDAQQAKNLAKLISTAKAWEEAGAKATSYAASIGRLIKETDEFVKGAAKQSAWAVKQRAEFMTLTAALKMFDRGVEEANSGMRISLAAKKADSQAVEKQAIAFHRAKAALNTFNEAQYAGTAQAKLQLAVKKEVIDATTRQALALERAKIANETFNESQYRAASQAKVDLSTKQAATQAIEKQAIALARAQAANESFNATQYAAAAQARISLADKKKDIDLSERKAAVVRSEQASLELLRTKQAALSAEEKKELATLQTLEALTKQRNALLARQSKELAPLVAEINALQAAERKATAAAEGFNLKMHLGAQLMASTRAGLYGMGASFGMYTSGTLLAAAASFAFFSALRSALSIGVAYEAQLQRLGAMASDAAKGSEEYAGAMERLDRAARASAMSTQYSALESATALTELALAGLSTGQAIQALPSVLNLAAVGALDTAKATEIATNTMMAFGLQVSDLPRVVDVLTKAAVDSNASVEDLGTAMGYVAPVAHAFGISLEFSAAAMEVLANAGIKGSRAGTSMRQILVEMFAPAEKGRKAMEAYGIAVNKVTEDVSGLESIEAGTKMPQLFSGEQYGTDALVDMIKQFDMATAGATKNLELIRDSVRVTALPAFVRLVQSLSMGKKGLIELAEEMGLVAGSTERAMEKIQDSVDVAFKKLRNAAAESALKAFDSQKGGLRELIDSLTDWLRVLANSPAVIDQFIVTIKSVGTALWRTIEAVVAFKVAILGITIGGELISAIKWLAMIGIPAVFAGLAKVASVLKVIIAEGIIGGLARLPSLFSALASSIALAATAAGGLGKLLLAWSAWPIAITAVGAAIYVVGEKLLGLGSAVADVKKGWDDLNAAYSADPKVALEANLTLLNQQRDTLEEQLRTIQNQPSELKRVTEELTAIRDKVKEANNALKEMSSLQLQAKLHTALSTEAAAKSKLDEAMEQMQKARRTGDMKATPEIRTEVIRPAIDKATIARIALEHAQLEVIGLKASIANASNDVQGSFEKLKKEGEAATAILDRAQADLKVTKTRLDAIAEDKRGEDQYQNLAKQYDALLGLVSSAKAVTSEFSAAQDALFERTSGETFEEIKKFNADRIDAHEKMLATISMTEEQRGAEQVRVLRAKLSEQEAAYQAAQLKFNKIASEIESSGGVGTVEQLDRLKLANAEVSGANAKRGETLTELDKVSARFNKTESNLIKSAAELWKANNDLEKQLMDQTRAYQDLDFEMKKHGAAYDLIEAKAISYAATLKKVTHSGAALPGAVSYGGAVPLSSARVGAVNVPGVTGTVNAYGGRVGELPRGYPATEAGRIVDEIDSRYNLSGALKTVWWLESRYGTNMNLTSPAGAKGPAQFMPATGRQYGIDVNNVSFQAMMEAAARKLSHDYALTGSMEGMFSLYNSSSATGYKRFPETKNYWATAQAMMGGAAPIAPSAAAERTAGAASSSGAASREALITSENTALVNHNNTVSELVGNKEALNRVDASAMDTVRRLRDLDVQHSAVLKQIGEDERDVAEAKALVLEWDRRQNEAQLAGGKLSIEDAQARGDAIDRLKSANANLNSDREHGLDLEKRMLTSGKMLTDRVKLYDDELNAARLQYDDVAAATEDYIVTQDILGRLLGDNNISQETYNLRMDEAATAVARAKGGYAEFFDSLKYNSKDFEEIGVGVMQEFEDAILDAVETGKLEFEDFFSYIKQLAAKFVVDQVILAAFNPSFSANISGPGAGGTQAVSGAAGAGASGNGYTQVLSNLSSMGTGTSIGGNMAYWSLNGLGRMGYTASSSAATGWAGVASTPNWAYGAAGLAGGLYGQYMYPDSPYAGIGGSLGATAGAAAGSYGGAQLGAAYGSAILPGIGTAVGAIVGTVAGSWLASTLGGGGKEAIATMGIDSGRFAFSNANQEMGKSGQVSQINAAKDQANALLDALTDALGMEGFVARSGFSQSQPLTGDQIGPWLTERTSAIADAMINAQSGIAGDLIKETWTNSGKDVNVLLQQVDVLKQIAAVLPQLTAYLQDSGMNLGSDPSGAALRLIKAAGGVQQFAGLRSQYFEAFGTEEEKLAAAHSALAAAFKDTGMALPETREELVKLVKSLDVTSETGLNSYVAILGLSGALDQLYTKSEDAAKAILEAAKATEAQKQSLTSILSGSLAADRLILSASGSRFSDLSDAHGVGATLSGSTKEHVSQQIELFGGMDAILKALGKDSEEWISAIDSYYAAEERLAASRQGAVDTLNGAILTEKEFAKVKAAAAAQTANQIAMSIHGIDITKKTVEQYREWMKNAGGADAVLKPLGDKAQQYSDAVAGYYSSMSTAIKSTDAPVKNLTKSLDSFVDSLTDWVAKVRSEDAKLKSPDQSLAFQYSAYAAQAALAKQGNKKAAEGITTYADAYLEAAKLSSRDRTEYDRIVGLVTAEVAAIARRFGGKGYADGGIATGPSTGYSATLHGTEAVIPLENGNIPLDISFEELVDEIRKLREDVVAVGVQQIKHSVTSSKTLRKWDTLGMPVTQP